MKKQVIFALTASAALMAQAQVLSVGHSNVSWHFDADGQEMIFGENNTITIGERTFSLDEFPKMKVVEQQPVAEKTVNVTYDGTTARVDVHGTLAQYVDVTVQGAHVSITQSELVSDAVCGEITYVLSGASTDGSFTLTGSYKASVDLAGLSLTNPSGAAIDLQDGKRIAVSAKSGTVNTLVDGAGIQKAALYCKGHLELKGKGSLTVTGNQAHAVSAKEYITIKNLTLNVNGAVKDGINCNQYFAMESGAVTVSGSGDDGIQVSYKDDNDREAEDTGTATISGGTLTIDVAKGAAAKGLKADGDINITGGTINIISSCNGTWDATKLKTKASACLGADGNIVIDGGALTLKASGSGGKGISCDGVFTANAGTVDIATTGGMLVYSNGTLNHNYTSSADRIASDYKSSAKGIKADSGLVINGGDFRIYTSTNNAEGIESKTTMEINGGNIFVKAYDDGINSSGNLTVTGGTITVVAITGDGIDSNANMYIRGGRIITLGSGGAEQGLDAADESGCAVYITGGEVLAFGGRGAPVKSTTGSQALVSLSASVAANNQVTVKSGTTVLATFDIPAEYNSSVSTSPFFGPGNGPGGGGWNPGGNSGSGKLLLSLPEMSSGTSYTVTYGTSTSTATASYTSSL